ncbi:MAG: hypothetical protein KF774_16345 [Planctomyces sp.]|nr:hypothetical protein [Planctomyces sp.]
MSRVAPLLLVGSLAVVGFSASAWWSDAHRVPQLEISPEFHVGELVHDQELVLSIGFRNAGAGLLRMQPPIPGCSCAPGELSATEFGPGEQGSFQVKLRPARPAGTEYAQEILVPSNDPHAPLRTVVVRGRMQGGLTSSPETLRVADARVGENWRREVTVFCTDPDAQFEILSADCDLAECEVFPPEPAADADDRIGPAFTILLTHRPDGVGHVSGTLTVATNHPRYRTLNVPIEIQAPSRLGVRPPALLFQAGPSAAGPQTVTVTASEPFELVVAEESDLFDVQASPADGDGWEVAVSLRGDAEIDRLQKTELRLRVTGVPQENELVIPVSALPRFDDLGAALADAAATED